MSAQQKQRPDPFKLSTWKRYLKETTKEFGEALSEVVGGKKEWRVPTPVPPRGVRKVCPSWGKLLRASPHRRDGTKEKGGTGVS